MDVSEDPAFPFKFEGSGS